MCDSARFIQAYKTRPLITLKLSERVITLTKRFDKIKYGQRHELATWIKSLQRCHSLWGISLRSHQQGATLHRGWGWSWTNGVSDVGDLQSLALASRHTHPNSITYKIHLIGLHLTTNCPESWFSHVDDKSEHQERLLDTSYRKLLQM